MENKLLPLDSPIVVISSQEAIRSQAYALLSLKGWQFECSFPEDERAWVEALNQDAENALIVVVDPDVQFAERVCDAVLKAGANSQRILLGVLPSSLGHRILARVSHAQPFAFDFKKTAIGPQVDLGEMPNTILKVISDYLGQCLDSEVRQAREAGGLPLLSFATNQPDDSKLIERALVTSTLLYHVSGKASLHRQAIRLALFFDLPQVKDWTQVLSLSRHLWPIKQQLETRASFLAQSSSPDFVFPSSLELPLLAVETAEVALRLRDSAGEEIVSKLSSRFANQSLELRVSLVEAAKKLNLVTAGLKHAVGQ